MADLRDSPEALLPFADGAAAFQSLDADRAADVARAAGELVLILNADGTIRDLATSAPGFVALRDWIGRPWRDTVTVDSRPKVEEMLSHRGSDGGRRPRWRQLTHAIDGADVAVRYLLIGLGANGLSLAIGRDMREAAALQQRLLQVQQSLERDYLRLRQAESRYRLLFETTAEPVMIVDAGSRRVREINPVAVRLLGAKPGSFIDQPLTSLVAEADREPLLAHLGAAASGVETTPLNVELVGSGEEATLLATAFRQAGHAFLLVRLADARAPAGEDATAMRLLDVVERMPDAFVLADQALAIVTANAAFADLTQAVSLSQLRGQPLGGFVGRPGIDLDLITAQLGEHGVASNVATIVRGLSGAQDDVELSAVATGGEDRHYGFSLRRISRRLRDLPPARRDLPRSVEQLTELVGRMPLKDIVRESTDLIERLCIEAALAYTSDNRASAAEILGLSRQSLYSKLHRHGLGNLVASPG